MAHPFFSKIDVEELMSKDLTPDLVPERKGDMYDVSHFDEEVTKMTPKESFVTEDERMAIK